MYRIGRKHIITMILTATSYILLAGSLPVGAQDLLAKSVVVFSGSPSRIAGFTVGDWGSGTSVFSGEMKYNSKQSLKVTTKDLGEGARIDITDPVDMSEAFANPNSFLQLVLNFGTPAGQSTTSNRQGGGMRAGMGGPAGGMGRTGGTGMAMGTRGGLGTSQLGGRGNARPNYIRVTLVLVSGEMLEARAPLGAYAGANSTGWVNVNFPLPIFKKNHDLQQYKVKRVIVSGDGSGSFYLGEIRTAEDSSSLRSYAGESREVTRLDTVTFEAASNTCLSPVKYSWDFGEAKGETCEDAIGRTVKHKFRAKGDFTVTLTVTDIFGLKTPETSTLKVRVRPLLSDHDLP